MRHYKLRYNSQHCAAIGIFIFLLNIEIAQSVEQFETVTLPLTTLSSTVWDTNVISVCWENSTNNNATERTWVQDAIAATWEKVSLVNFTGWQACETDSQGIRIKVADVGPATFGIGTQLDGKPDGMKLNFTFNNWSSSCQDGGAIPPGFNDPNAIVSDSHREYCIKAIAAHEFGHALGFPHEHNRSDRPDDCTRNAQGPDGDNFITPYDPDSIMNYCVATWNNAGRLSIFDIVGIQNLYGARPCLMAGNPCFVLDDLRMEYFDASKFLEDNTSDFALQQFNEIEEKINFIPALEELEEIDDSRLGLCRSQQKLMGHYVGAFNSSILRNSSEISRLVRQIKLLERDFYNVASELPMTVSMTSLGNICSSGAFPLSFDKEITGTVQSGGWVYYSVKATDSDIDLIFKIFDLSDDVDLYVKQGSQPTINSYHCRPYYGGNTEETCSMSNSGASTWYIGVHGYKSGSYKLKTISSGIVPLSDGQVVSGTVQLGKWTFYSFDTSTLNGEYVVELFNLSDDVDLYVKQGSQPTLDNYNCRPYLGGSSEESCAISNNGSAKWFIGIYGYKQGNFNVRVTPR